GRGRAEDGQGRRGQGRGQQDQDHAGEGWREGGIEIVRDYFNSPRASEAKPSAIRGLSEIRNLRGKSPGGPGQERRRRSVLRPRRDVVCGGSGQARIT